MDFLEEDARVLSTKGFISTEKIDQLFKTASQSEEDRKEAQKQLRLVLQQELDEIITSVRSRQNQKHNETLLPSDLVAVAAGGFLGAINTWMRVSSVKSTSTNTSIPDDGSGSSSQVVTTSIWASAFDAAQATLNVCRKGRLVEHLQIIHIAGDETTSQNVVFLINGFMTQGSDPMKNWSPLKSMKNVVCYAVLWEAGDNDVWNNFCDHANDEIRSSSASLVNHFASNPWYQAQGKAEQVGYLLANVLARSPTIIRGRKISLMGHSLGAMVIYVTLQELARLRKEDFISEKLIYNAVFFAGAFLPDYSVMQTVSQEFLVGGKIVNVYSAHDMVLSKLFRVAKLHQHDQAAAGCYPVDFKNIPNGANVDVTDLIVPKLSNQFGHSYMDLMEQVMARVLPQLLLV